jgi:hypothetical protein
MTLTGKSSEKQKREKILLAGKNKHEPTLWI